MMPSSNSVRIRISVRHPYRSCIEDSVFGPFASGESDNMKKVFNMKYSINYQDSLGKSLFTHVRLHTELRNAN